MPKRILILDNIRSMQNVGAIFRNADGAGWDTVYLTGYTPYPPRNEISKTALGAEQTVFWEYYENVVDIIGQLKKEGVRVYCLEVSNKAQDYRDFFWKEVGDMAIILWNEVKWVSQDLIDMSDEHIMIPMLGHKTSLNVSVAAWIVMYAFIKK